MNVEPKSIQFSLTGREFRQGSLAIYMRRLRRVGTALLAVFWVLFNAYLILEYGATSQPIGKMLLLCNFMFATGAGLWVVAMAAWCWFRAGMRHALAPEFFTDTSWEMQDEGFIFRRREDRITFPWKFFRRAYFTRDFLMLERQDGFSHLLPRKCFADSGKDWLDVITDRLRQPMEHEI